MTFAYDVSGILDVEVRVVATDQTISKTFVRNVDLSPLELERAQARIRQLKSDPRHRPRYRDALARAELLWSESSPQRRVQLGHILSAFEEALDAGHPGEIDRIYQAVLATCRTMDDDERW